MLLLWSAILLALMNHLMVQAYGPLKYVMDVSPNGEYIGWTKDKKKWEDAGDISTGVYVQARRRPLMDIVYLGFLKSLLSCAAALFIHKNNDFEYGFYPHNSFHLNSDKD